MNRFVTVVTLGIALVLSQAAFAGGEAGNGGDTVACSGQGEFKGYYALDYLLTFHESDHNSDIVPQDSWEHSVARIQGILAEKYPDLAKMFGEFVANIDNHTDYLLPRIWLEAGFGLIQVTDQHIISKIPKNCTNPDASGGIDLIQTVIRQQRPDITVYQYDPNTLSLLRQLAPLQYSFLLVHEWLWDFTNDIQVLREANRFFHSNQMESLSASDLKTALSHIGLDLNKTAFVPVCDRSPAVRSYLEGIESKPCQDITDLSDQNIAKKGVDLSGSGISSLKLGDFSGLGIVQSVNLNGNHLTSLWGGTFAGLYSMSWLNIASNQLTELPEDLFSENASLSVLMASGNRLTTLPENLFSVNPSIQDAQFQDNLISAIPAGFFDTFKCKVDGGGIQFNFSGNRITTLPDTLFDHLVKDCVIQAHQQFSIDLRRNPLTQAQKAILAKQYPIGGTSHFFSVFWDQ